MKGGDSDLEAVLQGGGRGAKRHQGFAGGEAQAEGGPSKDAADNPVGEASMGERREKLHTEHI